MAECGAKTRKGGRCRTHAMPNGRCKLHGGKSLKGKEAPGYKHGLYCKSLNAEEQRIWSDIPLGNLDDEIRLAKTLAARALEAEKPEEVALFLRRAERLEATRAGMNSAGQGAVDADEMARKIRGALGDIDAMMSPPLAPTAA